MKNKTGTIKPLVLSIFILFVVQINIHQVYAADYFAGVDASYNRVEIAGENFEPLSVRVRGGALFWHGIGVEANISAGISDDVKAGMTLELPIMASIYARFQTPYETGLRAYVLLGLTTVELDGQLEGDSFPGSERFTGPSVAIGLLDSLSFIPNTSLSLEIAGHFVDSEIDLINLGLGLQYEF